MNKPKRILIVGECLAAIVFLLTFSTSDLLADDNWSGNLNDLKESMNEVISQNEVLSAENDALRNKISNLQAELKENTATKEKLAREPMRLDRLLEEKATEVLHLEQTLRDLRNKNTQLGQENVVFEDEITKREGNRQPLSEEINILKEKIAFLERNIRSAEDKNQQFLKEAEDKKNKLVHLLADSEKRLFDAKTELEKTQGYAAPSSSKKATLIKQQEDLNHQLVELKSKLDERSQERQKLQEENFRLLDQAKVDINRLHDRINNLQIQNQDLKNSLSALQGRPGKRESISSADTQELGRKVSLLEKEKNFLKEEVSSLMETIVLLNREKAIIESFLDIQTRMLKQQKIK